MIFTDLFDEQLVERGLPEVEGDDGHAVGNETAQECVGLLLTADTQLILAGLLAERLNARGADLRRDVLLGLERQMHAAIALLDLVEVALQNFFGECGLDEYVEVYRKAEQFVREQKTIC